MDQRPMMGSPPPMASPPGRYHELQYGDEGHFVGNGNMAQYQHPLTHSMSHTVPPQNHGFVFDEVVPEKTSRRFTSPQPPLQHTASNGSYNSPPQTLAGLRMNSTGSDSNSSNNANKGNKSSAWYHGMKYDVEEMWKAALGGDNDLLKRCLKAGLNVNLCRWVKQDRRAGSGARSLANIVVSRNNIAAMRMLLEYPVDLTGATVETFSNSSRLQRDMLFRKDELKDVLKDTWTTPLHQACSSGYVELVRILLDEARVDPNQLDSRKRTPLYSAVSGSRLEVAKFLLSRRVGPELADITGTTPLAAASYLGKKDFVHLLLDYGAKIDATDDRGEAALYNASIRYHPGIMETLIEWGADVDLRNVDGMSPFFKVASFLKTESMDLLADCGANVDSRDNNGCTALNRAVFAKNMVLIKHLLHLGCDIDAEDGDGWTPLFAAMIHDDEDLLRLILSNGPNMEKTDNHGNTALHSAAILGSTTVVRHILTSSPQIRQQMVVKSSTSELTQINLFGETPLALAAKHNNSAIVKLLLKHGADAHHIDPNGHRAIDRAMYWGSHASIRHLCEAGAVIDARALQALIQGKHDTAVTSVTTNTTNDANTPKSPPTSLNTIPPTSPPPPSSSSTTTTTNTTKTKGTHHEMIINRVQHQYRSIMPPPTSTTPQTQLTDLFSRTSTLEGNFRRMREKQGYPPDKLDRVSSSSSSQQPDTKPSQTMSPPPAWSTSNSATAIPVVTPSTTTPTGAAGAAANAAAKKKKEEDEEEKSPDPFEACIPKAAVALQQILSGEYISGKLGMGAGKNALAGAAGEAAGVVAGNIAGNVVAGLLGL